LVGGGLQQAAPELLIHPGMGDGGGAEMGADEFFVIADEPIDFLLGEDAPLHQQALKGQNPLLEGRQGLFAGLIARLYNGRSPEGLQFRAHPPRFGLRRWGLGSRALGRLTGFHLGEGGGGTGRQGGEAGVAQKGAARPTGHTVAGGGRLILGTRRGIIGRGGHGGKREKAGVNEKES
jgi:hypothetical protein